MEFDLEKWKLIQPIFIKKNTENSYAKEMH